MSNELIGSQVPVRVSKKQQQQRRKKRGGGLRMGTGK